MGAVQTPIAYHLAPEAAWAGTAADAPFRAASLETEGFVHLTHRMTDLVDVANEFYLDEAGPHVVLTIALRRLDAPWRYDGDERFPHVYGPLSRRAITEVRVIPRDADGTYRPIERPDVRRPPDVPALLARLDAARVDFLVLGSGAAALLGADLAPGDLDICPAPDADNLGRLAGVLEAIGARPRVDVPGWVTDEEAVAWRPVAEIGALDHLFETDLGDLDIVFETLGPDGRGSLDHRGLAEDTITVEVAGRSVVVASPASLLASKGGARRPKDLRALAELERLVDRYGTEGRPGVG